jgi:hypothetical protein
MQDPEEFNRHAHTAGQAVSKVKTCCGDFNYRVNYRILTTFHGAILLVLSFLTTTMIQRGIDGEKFDLTQFAVIMLLVLVAVVFDYTKEQFLERHKMSEKRASTSAHMSSHHPHKGYAHTFYQG